MARTTKKLAWTKLNTASLPAHLKPSWADVQKAQKALADAKAKFEPMLTKVLVDKKLAVVDDTNVIRVGYNFGGLSYAQDTKSEGGAASGGVDLD